MKVSRWLVAAAIGGAVLAASAPAWARVTVGRAESICEAAALTQVTPTPERARARDVVSNSEAYTVSLVLSGPDGAARRATCVVNRESGEATVTVNN